MARARSLAFTVASGVVLAYLLWRIFAPFLAPIAWAAVLAILLMPVYRRLRERLRRPNLAAFLATSLTILLVVVPAVLVTIAMLRQAQHLYGIASTFVRTHRVTSPEELFRVPVFHRLIGRVSSFLPVSSADLQAWAEASLKTLAAATAGIASTIALSFLGMVASFFVMLFTLFFFFRDGEALWSRVIAAIPLDPGRSSVLIERLHSVLRAVMIGTLLTAVLQGGLGAIGFAVLGLPSPIVFGALMAVLSLLPVGGTALVWVPAAIVLAAQGSWGRAIALVAWGAVIVGLADNWFKPMIISGRSEMNTLPIFFGVMGGLAAFGFLGIFVGPLVVSLGIAAWDTASASTTDAGSG